MKTFSYDFNYDEITIIPISDTHIGSAEFSEHRLREVVDYIVDHEKTYCILAGDILDMCIPDSVASADIYNSTSPAVALGLACKIFEKISSKILMVCDGNHEARQIKHSFISPLMQLCVFLKIEEKYAPNGAYLFLNLTQRKGVTRTYTMYIAHGSANSSKVGGKLSKLADYSNAIDADVYVVGHSHLPATFKQDYLKPSETTKSLKQFTRMYVNLCAYLVSGGYGERKGYIPATIAQPKIILRLRRRQSKNREQIEKEMYCIV